jgi:hypothetical protein
MGSRTRLRFDGSSWALAMHWALHRRNFVEFGVYAEVGFGSALMLRRVRIGDVLCWVVHQRYVALGST